MSFTPGPWEIVGATRIWSTGAGGGAVAIIAEPECKNSGDFAELDLGSPRWREAMANAALISAATEMLAALKELIAGKVQESSKHAAHPSGRFCIACGLSSRDRVHSGRCPVFAAERALAKAEGEQGQAIKEETA